VLIIDAVDQLGQMRLQESGNVSGMTKVLVTALAFCNPDSVYPACTADRELLSPQVPLESPKSPVRDT
jgi:hypothetical protein